MNIPLIKMSRISLARFYGFIGFFYFGFEIETELVS